MSNKVTTSTQTVAVTLPSDHILELGSVRTDKNYPIPPYGMLGRPGKSKHKIEGIDAPSLFKQLSGSAHWFFWTLVEARNHETNLVKPKHIDLLSKKERGRITRAYKELEKMRLVVRTARQTYLINPKVMLPSLKYYERTWVEWEAACSKKGLSSKSLASFKLPTSLGSTP